MYLFHRRLVLAKVMEGVLRGEHEDNAWPSIKGDRVRSRAATYLLDQTPEHGFSRVEWAMRCYCEKTGHSTAEGQTNSVPFPPPNDHSHNVVEATKLSLMLMSIIDYRE